MTPANIAQFFLRGEHDVASVFAAIEKCITPGLRPGRALDFGCGVGRLVIPMSRLCGQVVGVDVSDAMLAESRKNAERADVTNAEFVKGDDALSKVQGKFDFVHSYIVLQHIPVARGEAITRRLLELLEPGGVGALHYTYATGLGPKSRTLLWARMKVPFANPVLNMMLGRKPSAPVMQLNNYSMDRILGILQDAGCTEVHTILTDHQGNRGGMLLFRKPSAPK
ncbi:MAG: class I SAM-dependent methyltransferase [Gemmatimonadaceae bacterium]|nr:class I SAM-dependent methyltransferase [Gemmatimonadaceae bacterium]